MTIILYINALKHLFIFSGYRIWCFTEARTNNKQFVSQRYIAIIFTSSKPTGVREYDLAIT